MGSGIHGGFGNTKGSRENKSNNTNAKVSLPTNQSQLKHIFRNEKGHLKNTLANQKLIVDLANNKKHFKGKDKYGNRLDGINKVALKSSFIKDTESKLLSEEIVKKAEIIVTGKIVYISMGFNAPAALVDAQSMAQKSLEYFSDEEKAFYDFNFTLREDKTEASEGFLISGYKNSNGSGLVWNNNNPVTEENESTEKSDGE